MTDTTTDTPEKTGKSWRDKALQVAGAGYSVGDVAMGAAGILRGKDSIDVVKGSLIWLAGGLAAAKYGHPDPHKQLEIFSQKFEQHLKTQGVTIPDDVRAQNALLKKPTFLQKCESFLYQHPSEMLNLAYAIGSAFVLKTGIQEVRAGKDIFPKLSKGFTAEAIANMSNSFWIGGLVGSGALAGLLIKEDPEAMKKAEHGNTLEKMAAYIKEKPLRLTGTLYGLNNIFTVMQARDDYKKRADFKSALKPHHFSTATAATYIMSNVLLTSASRDQNASGFSGESMAKLEEMAAQIIAAEPAAKQKELLADVSTYLASQKGITLKAPEIAQALAERISTLTQERLQPAVEQAKWAAREASRAQDATVENSR